MRQGFRALVVDDDEFSRRTAVSILKRLGATDVVEANAGTAALCMVTAVESPVDLIVCDLKMPDLDGIETLEALAERCPTASLVILSGAESRLLRAAADTALRSGIRNLRVVSKPVTLAKMQPVIAGISAPPAETDQPSDLAPKPIVSAYEIRGAIARGELTTFYQPKVDIHNRRVRGAEALMRWHHPSMGLLTPSAFLGVAQKHGLLHDFLYVALAAAGPHCAAWRDAGHDFGVSINMPVTVLSSRELPRMLEEFVNRIGLTPSHVTFEVTEDGWLQDQDLARDILTRLRIRGFGLAIDDYGTGYSGLQQLLHAPFNEMKIDQGFVRSAPIDPEASIAMASSVALARRLDMTVVAEGVETEAEWDVVAELGCDQVQGFLISRPLPVEQFIHWLAEQRQPAV